MHTPQSLLDYKSAYSWLDKQHENYLTRQRMCVFANSVWNLNKLNTKSKFINHGDLTVIQQPVISCWQADGVVTLLSSMESVFFKVVQSVCHSAVTRQTHGTENHFHGFHLVDEIAATSVENTIRHHMGQVLSFIENDLIRDRCTKGNSTAGHTIFTQEQCHHEQ